MRQISYIFKLSVLLPLILFLGACSQQDIETQPRENVVSFGIYLPGPQVVESRSTGTADENRIADIWVLAFDPATGALLLKERGSTPTAVVGSVNNNHWNFTVPIPPGSYHLWLVANENGMLSTVTPGPSVTQTTLSQSLMLEVAGKWPVNSSAVQPIPMWGELANQTITETSTPIFTLTRMLARINVSVDPTAAFDLTSIHYYNRNTKGMLIPDPARFQAGLPTDYGQNMGKASNAVSYIYGTDFSDHKQCLNRIYVVEASHVASFPGPNADWDADVRWKDNPCLVVGGIYDPTSGNTTETFYRVDFIERQSSSTATWHSVLRNSSYNVVVNSVSAPGYASASTAAVTAPQNMDYSAYRVSESGMSTIVMDGPYYLISSLTVANKIVNSGDETEVFTLKTNFPEGWNATLWNDEACTVPLTDGWMTVEPSSSTSPTPVVGEVLRLVIPLKTVGTRYMKLTAGRSSLVVRVAMQPASP